MSAQSDYEATARPLGNLVDDKIVLDSIAYSGWRDITYYVMGYASHQAMLDDNDPIDLSGSWMIRRIGWLTELRLDFGYNSSFIYGDFGIQTQGNELPPEYRPSQPPGLGNAAHIVIPMTADDATPAGVLTIGQNGVIQPAFDFEGLEDISTSAGSGLWICTRDEPDGWTGELLG